MQIQLLTFKGCVICKQIKGLAKLDFYFHFLFPVYPIELYELHKAFLRDEFTKSIKTFNTIEMYFKLGVGPSQARLGSARLVTIEEKSSEKARLEPGSVTFGSWLGSARSQLARWLVSHRRAKVYLDERNFVS